jgi:sugar phosphate isomerase/epimerase
MIRKERVVSRREAIKLGGLGAATALAASGARELFGMAGAAIPIGLQLYSLREEAKTDLPGVIAAVGKMGYQGIEFAGYYDRSAADLRKMLDAAGLTCCGTHTGLETLLGDNLAKTIEFNEVLGNKYLIVPWLGPERHSSKQVWLETAKLFDELAEKLKPASMHVGYHNHDWEFKTAFDGTSAWDLFFSSTPKEVVMQLDVGNGIEAGCDPVATLKKHPGRALTIHVKEHSKANPTAPVGEGDVDWKAIFDLCESVGGTQWYIVEYESATARVGVAKSLANLRKMGK